MYQVIQFLMSLCRLGSAQAAFTSVVVSLLPAARNMNLEKVRRLVRSKALNVLERVEQLEGPTQVEVEHLDAAIKYLGKMWDECKSEFTNNPTDRQLPRRPTTQSEDAAPSRNP